MTTINQQSLFDLRSDLINRVPVMPLPVETGDICAKRHRNNARSVEANQRVDKAWQHKAILAVLDTGNFTGQEIADRIGVVYSTISGRFKFLRETNPPQIAFTGERRGGGNEYRRLK